MSCCNISGSTRGRWVVVGLLATGVAAIAIESKWANRAAADPNGNAVEQNPAPTDGHVAAKTPEAAGRYLVMISGCNDCHTPGFTAPNAKVPELEWLTGAPIGWFGPWGTTYASNLRLMVADMPEDAWVKMLHERHDRPPMPWASVNAMSEQDTRALYQYIKALGKRGEKTPDPLPPGAVPRTPFRRMGTEIPKSP